MSYWINEMRCNKCSTVVNVPGGVIGTTWMGPKVLRCPNELCGNIGIDNFSVVDNPLNPFHVPEDEEMNACLNCGFIGDFWFDRTIDENDSMNYRCQKCGAIDGIGMPEEELSPLVIDPCDFCGKIQTVKGALLFGPPNEEGLCEKVYCCVICWKTLEPADLD